MKTSLKMLFLSFILQPLGARAAEAAAISPSGGILKMMIGLVIVLAVMAFITWGLKRVMPSVGGNKQSVVRVVGGVSVGSRERVVVLEIAGRWIVVGVAAGQINGLANLDAGSQLSENVIGTNLDINSQLNPNLSNFTQSFVPSFAQWLKKSTAKFTETKISEIPDAK
jgi:flagellar protein FliO/FliZ